MSRTANLLLGTVAGFIAYALALAFFSSALGFSQFRPMVAGGFALPPLMVGWLAFRKNPDGRWWIAPIVSVLAMSALIVATILYFVMTMDRL